MLPLAALDGQASDWLATFGPIVFYLIVWGLVFSGTGLFVGVFIPFVTGDSLLFAAGLIAARADNVAIWVLATGVGVAAFLGDQVGFLLGRHYGRPYLDRRRGGWIASAVAKSEKFYADLGALVWGVLITVTGYFAATIPGVKSSAYVIGGAFILASVVAGVVSWRRNRATL